MPKINGVEISKCGNCPVWIRVADRYLQNVHKGEPLNDLFPYCHDVNNHMSYEAKPECEKPPYRI